MRRSIFHVLKLTVLLVCLSTTYVSAHSGRTDSSGGHNCYVGSCAGTYHYHNGGRYTPPPVREPVVTLRNVSKTKSVHYKTIEKKDPNLYIGQTEVTRKGVNGARTIQYTVTYHDGIRIRKDQVDSWVTQKPVNELISVGTKPLAVSTESVAPHDNTGKPETSTGETVGGLAIFGAVTYGLFRLGKYGLSKIG